MGKIAGVLFAQELSAQFQAEGHNVLVNACSPGAVATGLVDHIIGEGGQIEQALGRVGRTILMEYVLPIKKIAWQPRDACLNHVYCAASTEVAELGITGKYFQSVARDQLPHPHCQNAKMQQWLWDRTEQLIREVSSRGEKSG